ncbi:MAG: hypothetical protein QW343_03555 [Candidatus Norongarragalinales archaeon]
MRFFKHGDVLAITLPESLRAQSRVREGDEYEWFEVEPGFFALVEKTRLNGQVKQSFAVTLVKKAFEAASVAAEKTGGTVAPLRAEGGFAPRGALAGGTEKTEPGKRELEERGFTIIQNEAEAKALSVALESDIKRGAVRGVRGFDKKYYVVSQDYLQEVAPKIRRALAERPLALGAIAAAVKADADGVLAVLYVLKEEGEVIEKKRGIFALVK